MDEFDMTTLDDDTLTRNFDIESFKKLIDIVTKRIREKKKIESTEDRMQHVYFLMAHCASNQLIALIDKFEKTFPDVTDTDHSRFVFSRIFPQVCFSTLRSKYDAQMTQNDVQARVEEVLQLKYNN